MLVTDHNSSIRRRLIYNIVALAVTINKVYCNTRRQLISRLPPVEGLAHKKTVDERQ